MVYNETNYCPDEKTVSKLKQKPQKSTKTSTAKKPVGVTMVGPMLVLRLFRSKLRKREDHATLATPAADVVLHNVTSQSTPPTATTASTTTAVCTISTTSLTTATPASTAPTEETQPTSLGLWQYPPQYTMYTTDKETLVHPVPVERPKFCRGIRKNLSGRWKRLTKKKPVDEPYKIPADLRDQLKSIYVY